MFNEGWLGADQVANCRSNRNNSYQGSGLRSASPLQIRQVGVAGRLYKLTDLLTNHTPNNIFDILWLHITKNDGTFETCRL